MLKSWERALQEAYLTAYGSELSRYHGQRPREYDDQGLHSWSAAWGRVEGVEAAVREITGAELSEVRYMTSPYCHPDTIKRVAEEDALKVFTKEIKREVLTEEINRGLIKELGLEEKA